MAIPPTPRRLVVDTDPGIDDALALLVAFGTPGVEVEAVTTVAGNCPVTVCTRNAAALCELAMKAVPIAAGADRPLLNPLVTALDIHGEGGLGEAQLPAPRQQLGRGHAVETLISRVLSAPGEVTIVALGPLTNLALALRIEPRMVDAVQRVVVMGGALRVPGNHTPHAEFNAFVDPHAAAIVFEAGLPLTLVPLDVTRQVRLTPDLLAELVALAPASPIMRFVGDLVARDMRRPPDQNPGFTLHDPLAMAVAIDPTIVRTELLDVDVVLAGDQAGGTMPHFHTGGTVRAATAVDVEPAYDLMRDGLGRLASALPLGPPT